MKRALRGGLVAGLLAGLLVAMASAPGRAQHEASGVPGIPAGPGALYGEVVHPDGDAELAGLEVRLLALQADGRPGLNATRTSGGGLFSFENLTNAADTAFLVTVDFQEILFTQRFSFAPGQEEQRIIVEISDPIAKAEGLRHGEARMHFQMGSQGVDVRVEHQLEYEGEQVVFVPTDARAGSEPLFTTRLPSGASEFQWLVISPSDGLEQRGDELLFWGPVYPGGQEIRFQYVMEVSDRELELTESFPDGLDTLLVTVAEEGIELASPRLSPAPPVEVEGRTFRAFSAEELAAGEEVDLALVLPALRSDSGALSLSEATLWVELDDTNLVVNTEVTVSVTPGAGVIGSAEEPLLHLALPPGAELRGVSPEVTAVGSVRVDDGFDVLGPIAAGDTRIGYKYQLPSSIEGARLDLQYPMELSVLRLLVADTGVVIETDRLHRRRPIRSGTRSYLHREAFQVGADERVSIGLRPLEASAMPPSVSLGLVSLAALASGWLILRPLRSARMEVDATEELETQTERALLYAAIRDLDHDYETGKVEEADYQASRQELRARAVDSLRRERELAETEQAETEQADAPEASPVATGRFCPGCGATVDSAWRFCSHCGGALSPDPDERESAK